MHALSAAPTLPSASREHSGRPSSQCSFHERPGISETSSTASRRWSETQDRRLEDPEGQLLAAIAAGELDEDLVAIADAVHARYGEGALRCPPLALRNVEPRSVDPAPLTGRLSGGGVARRQPTNPADPLPVLRGSEASGLRTASPNRFARRISRARALSACSGELARRARTRRFRRRQAVRTPVGHVRAATRAALRDSARSAGAPPGAQHDRQPAGCLRSRRGHYDNAAA